MLVGSVYLLLLPGFARGLLEFVLAGFDDVKPGSLAAAMAMMFFPVTFFGMFSPFAIRLLLDSPQRSGRCPARVYGVSTAGIIVGTLGTTFFLIPAIGIARDHPDARRGGLLAGGPALRRWHARQRRAARGCRRRSVAAPALTGIATPEDLIDDKIRADDARPQDGQLAHIETEYNDIYITKRRAELTMSFQLKGWDYTESLANLKDPDDLPLNYTHNMTLAMSIPRTPRRVLMIGLGGGSISTYLGRHMPDLPIDTVEIDPGVVTAAKQYFGIRETRADPLPEGDGRVFLNRRKRPLRHHPARRLPRRLRAVPPAHQGILYAGEATADADRRRRLQRA